MNAKELGNDKAFPLISPDGTGVNQGMSLREYFAAKAMQGLLANSEWMEKYKGVSYLMPNHAVAENAIGYADALLAELSKPTDQ